MKLLIVAAACCFLFSCTKDHPLDGNYSEPSNSGRASACNPATAGRLATSGLSLSSYGFLKFSSSDAYADFVKSMATSTVWQAKKVMMDLGYNSLGNQQIDSTHNADTLTAAQYELFLQDGSGFLQIDDVIIKQAAAGDYIYTCNVRNFNSTVYSSMASDTYNSAVMNQLGKNVSRDDHFDIVEYCHGTTHGTSESNPATFVGKRKFIGWGEVHNEIPAVGYGAGYCFDQICEKYFVFGVGVSGDRNCQNGALIMCTP